MLRQSRVNVVPQQSVEVSHGGGIDRRCLQRRSQRLVRGSGAAGGFGGFGAERSRAATATAAFDIDDSHGAERNVATTMPGWMARTPRTPRGATHHWYAARCEIIDTVPRPATLCRGLNPNSAAKRTQSSQQRFASQGRQTETPRSSGTGPGAAPSRDANESRVGTKVCFAERRDMRPTTQALRISYVRKKFIGLTRCTAGYSAARGVRHPKS